MCIIEKSYEAFVRLINAEDSSVMKKKSFRQICHYIHASPASLEEILMEELGMSSQEIMNEYFGNTGVF